MVWNQNMQKWRRQRKKRTETTQRRVSKRPWTSMQMLCLTDFLEGEDLLTHTHTPDSLRVTDLEKWKAKTSTWSKRLTVTHGWKQPPAWTWDTGLELVENIKRRGKEDKIHCSKDLANQANSQWEGMGSAQSSCGWEKTHWSRWLKLSEWMDE